MNLQESNFKQLIQALLALKTEKETSNFLRDLLTEREIKEFATRWKAARLLSDKISYSKIEEETGLSSTTIARISKWLNNGMGGYQLMINRVHHTNPSRK